MATEDDDLFVPEGEAEQNAPEPEADDEQDDETLEISFGEDEPPPKPAPDSDLVRKLRSELADRNRQLAALRPVEKPIEVGDKPKPDDFYASNPDDPEAAYDDALLAWNGRKAKAQTEADARKKAAEDSNAAWQKELDGFATKKAALKAPDFDAAEETVVGTLSQLQQAVIIQGAEDSAKVIYALGKHPDKLAAIAAITNPVKLAVAIAALERTITVNTTRRPPPPENNVRGSAPLSRTTDKVLEKMEADAAKDPLYDRGAILRYKNQKAAARAPAGRR